MNPNETGGQLPPPSQTPQQPYTGGQPAWQQPVAMQPQMMQPQPFVQPQQFTQQPAPQSAPLGEQYNFIMNPSKPHKPTLIAGGSALKRGGIIAGGLAILVMLAVIAVSIFSGGRNTATIITPVMQQQTELIRITTAAGLVTTQQNTQALTNAVNLSITSAQQQLSTYLAQNHQKIKPATLVLTHSKAVDTQLTNAKANDTYDTTLTGILQNDLTSYSQALKTAYAANPGSKGRQLLSKQYDAAQLLLKQAKQ